jgi:hypothetical protein
MDIIIRQTVSGWYWLLLDDKNRTVASKGPYDDPLKATDDAVKKSIDLRLRVITPTVASAEDSLTEGELRIKTLLVDPVQP